MIEETVMRMMATIGLGCVALAGCVPAQRQSADNQLAGEANTEPPAPVENEATPLPARQVTPTTASTSPLSCVAEIGAAAARRKVKACLNVSPATHPPCNAANSCAMIDDEIARSCALFAGKGAPMVGCDIDPHGTQAAVAVVTRYYAALNARDYGTAWLQWGENGPPHQTQASFAAGFAHTRATHVTIGTLPPGEGAAGSSYQEVPVTVDATLDSGAQQRFTGSYVVRRVNDVDGATPAQLRWHIDSAKLNPAR